MATRRDWLLQQLGITQWALRRPTVLQGEVAVSLPEHTQLLIVADVLPPEGNSLVNDLIRSLSLHPSQVYCLQTDQVAMLPEDTHCNTWRLGISEPLTVAGAQLYSPALAELSQDAGAKRALWQQICENEQHFYPDSRGSDARL
ncbi:MAG: DNA polymerase III subunit psi [Rouxiella badensis]|uniref:DNA polymerase III subunit psi n=1 Tax=Rouxiella badensis TaxID=1646377 RepID=UPI003C474860